MSALAQQLATAQVHGPTGGGLPVMLPAAPRIAESDAEHCNGNTLDHGARERLLCERGEKLAGIVQAVTLAGCADTAAIEAASETRAEDGGANRHETSSKTTTMQVAPDSRSVTRFASSADARLDKMMSSWREWCLAMPQIDDDGPADLASLAVCEEAHATNYVNPYFFIATEFDAEDLETVRQLLGKPGRELVKQAWLEHQARKPAFSLAERDELQRHMEARGLDLVAGDDVGSRVQIISDLSRVFPGGDGDAYVRDYARSLPSGWNEGVLVSLAKNGPPVVCRWTRERVHISTTRNWASSLQWVAGGQRFKALESYSFEGDQRVLIPSAAAPRAVSVQQLAVPPKNEPQGRILATGIGALDAALATKGIATGARVVVQAGTAQGKTTFMLEAAESLAARGVLTVWIATRDEPRESLMARRRQRIGISRAEALTSTDESGLNLGLVVLDGRTVSLEEVLACRHQIGCLFVDSVAKVRTSTGATDPTARIEFALDLIETSGLTTFMSAPIVRNAGRRAKTERAKGGAGVEGGATLLLELTRTGASLSVDIVKSRYGGEGEELALRLDAERQRVVELPESASTREAILERIWNDLQRELAARGPTSAKALAEQVVRGKAPVIRDVIKEKLACGLLAMVDKKVGLAQ